MPGRNPLRYEATGELIVLGDWVLAPVAGKLLLGVVRHVSPRNRKVEVWLRTRAADLGLKKFPVRRSVCRRDVVPVPGRPRVPVPVKLHRNGWKSP